MCHQPYLLLGTLLCVIFDHAHSQPVFPFDYEGHPITQTSLSYSNFSFMNKGGNQVSAFVLVDQAHARPVVPHHRISGFYFYAVPASAEALQKARRDYRRRQLLGWGSYGMGFTTASMAFGLSDAKTGETFGPLLFLAGFASGTYFLFKASIKARKDFNQCIATFNAHQSTVLPALTEIHVSYPDKVLHTIKQYRGYKYDSGNSYVTKVKSTEFTVGTGSTAMRFNRKHLKPYLISTPTSAALYRKASLHRTFKLTGLGLVMLGYASGSAFSNLQNETGTQLAMGAGITGFGLLCTRKVKTLLTQSVRAYNISQYTGLTSLQMPYREKWKLQSIGLVPLGAAGRITPALSFCLTRG